MPNWSEATCEPEVQEGNLKQGISAFRIRLCLNLSREFRSWFQIESKLQHARKICQAFYRPGAKACARKQRAQPKPRSYVICLRQNALVLFADGMAAPIAHLVALELPWISARRRRLFAKLRSGRS
jgi:hypothetical protein